MPRKPLAMLFDFNGVIVDDEPVHREAYDEVLQRRDWSLSEEEYFSRYLGLDDRGFFHRFIGDRGKSVSEPEVDALIAEKAAAYLRRLPEVRLCPGASGALRSIGAAIPTAIVSGALRSEIEVILERFELRGSVRTVVAAEDVKRGKPAPDGYLLGLARLGIADAGTCLAVEDSPAGVRAARAAGLNCWAVSTSRPPSALEGAIRVLHSLEHLNYDELSIPDGDS